MRYSLAAILAFSSSVLAQTVGFDVITVPTNLQSLVVGQTINIVWDATTEVSKAHPKINIYLLQGASQGSLQQARDPIALNVDNSLGTYAWTPKPGDGYYALSGIQISSVSDNTIFQYSFPFTITDPSLSAGSGLLGESSVVSANPSGVQLNIPAESAAPATAAGAFTPASAAPSVAASVAASLPAVSRAAASPVGSAPSVAANPSYANANGTAHATGSSPTAKGTGTTTTTGGGAKGSGSSSPSIEPTSGAGLILANSCLALFGALLAAIAL